MRKRLVAAAPQRADMMVSAKHEATRHSAWSARNRPISIDTPHAVRPKAVHGFANARIVQRAVPALAVSPSHGALGDVLQRSGHDDAQPAIYLKKLRNQYNDDPAYDPDSSIPDGEIERTHEFQSYMDEDQKWQYELKATRGEALRACRLILHYWHATDNEKFDWDGSAELFLLAARQALQEEKDARDEVSQEESDSSNGNRVRVGQVIKLEDVKIIVNYVIGDVSMIDSALLLGKESTVALGLATGSGVLTIKEEGEHPFTDILEALDYGEELAADNKNLATFWLEIFSGGFAKNLSEDQVIIRTLLTLIPGIDTLGDIQDFAAALVDIVTGQGDPGEAWGNLALAAAGFLPLGSLLHVLPDVIGGTKKVPKSIKKITNKLDENKAEIKKVAKETNDDVKVQADEALDALDNAPASKKTKTATEKIDEINKKIPDGSTTEIEVSDALADIAARVLIMVETSRENRPRILWLPEAKWTEEQRKKYTAALDKRTLCNYRDPKEDRLEGQRYIWLEKMEKCMGGNTLKKRMDKLQSIDKNLDDKVAKDLILIPAWGKGKECRPRASSRMHFTVDHMVELQAAMTKNGRYRRRYHKPDNFQLMTKYINSSSGKQLDHNIGYEREVFEQEKGLFCFEAIAGPVGGEKAGKSDIWSWEEICSGEHLDEHKNDGEGENLPDKDDGCW